MFYPLIDRLNATYFKPSKKIMEDALYYLLAELNWEAGIVFLLVKREQAVKLELVASKSISVEYIDAMRTVDIGDSNIPPETILENIMVFNNLHSENLNDSLKIEAEKQHFIRMVSYPLSFFGQVVGIMQLFSKLKGGSLSQNEVQVLESLSTQISVIMMLILQHEEIIKLSWELYNVHKKLKQQSKEFQQIDKQLKVFQKFKEIREFFSDTSHELKTPLTSILGYTDFLMDTLESNLQPKQREAFENIISSSEDMLKLVNDILDLSKLEAGEMQLKIKDVELEKIVKKAISTVIPMAEARQIKVTSEIEENLKIVSVDPLRFQQILVNLLSNAVKYNIDRGAIHLKAYTNGNFFMVSIKDTGIGISETEVDKIFQRFKQTDQTVSVSREGVGLGLAITNSLVKLHNGDIWLESKLQAGSTFFVCLPMKKTEDADAINIENKPNP